MTTELLNLMLGCFEDEKCITPDNCIGHFDLDYFERIGVLELLPYVKTTECPECGRRSLDVRRRRDENNKAVYYCKCGRCGRQIIDPKRLRIWRIHREPVVRLLTEKLSLTGFQRELLSNHTWILGKRDGIEYILVRDAHISQWREFQSVMARHANATVLSFKHYTRDMLAKVIDHEIASLDEITTMNESGEIAFDLSAFGSTIASRVTPPDFQFVKRGGWLIRFYGTETILPDELAGMPHIYSVLRHPNEPIEIQDMIAEDSGSEIARSAGRGEAKMDSMERSACVRRLQELATERRDAETNGDMATLDRINEEFTKIEYRVRRESTWRGHEQKLGDEVEKMKRNVVKRINIAIRKIGEHDERLAKHLKASIKCGNSIVYQPTEPVDWLFT